MEIQIKKENYKQLVQCVYLGNLVINQYRKEKDSKKEYSQFLQDILLQIVKGSPAPELRFKLQAIPYKKNQDNQLSDLYDKIEDSVKEFYTYFCKNLLLDKLGMFD